MKGSWYFGPGLVRHNKLTAFTVQERLLNYLPAGSTTSVVNTGSNYEGAIQIFNNTIVKSADSPTNTSTIKPIRVP